MIGYARQAGGKKRRKMTQYEADTVSVRLMFLDADISFVCYTIYKLSSYILKHEINGALRARRLLYLDFFSLFFIFCVGFWIARQKKKKKNHLEVCLIHCASVLTIGREP